MTRRSGYTIGFTAVVAALAGVVIWSYVPIFRPGIVVAVKNSNPTPIHMVEVHFGGRTTVIGTVAAGKTVNGRIVPVADSAVAIDWQDSAGTRHQVHVDTYVTGGYGGRMDAEIRGGQLVNWRENIGVDLLTAVRP